MRINLLRSKPKFWLLSAVTLSLVLAAVAGCAGGPSPRGWSGVVAGKDILYVGAMDGRVVAMNPSARAQNSTFPSQGEWEYTVRVTPKQSAFSCAPTATSAGFYGSPGVASDLVYVATYEGKIYALNGANGSLRWVYPRETGDSLGAIIGAPAIAGDSLYVASADANLYSFDLATGDRKWQFTTSGRIWTSPAIAGDTVYVGNFEGDAYAVSAKDGKQVWKIKIGPAISSVSATANLVLFGSFDDQLRAFDAKGTPVWSFRGGNWFWSPAMVSGDTVYADCLDNNIYAINARTGAQLWKFDSGSPLVSSPVLIGNQLLAVSQNGNVNLIAADRGTPVRTVKLETEVMAPPLVQGSMVYIHSRDQKVHAINLQSGESVWKFSTIPPAR